MGTHLLIRLQGPPDEPIYTVIQDGGADHQTGLSGPLKAVDLRALVSGKSVQVLVPSNEIVLTRVQLPKTSTSRLAKAIPYALEEYVVDDVEALHFAFTIERDGIAVAVVARSTLDAWLQSLRSIGIEPNALIPDVLAVPRSPDTWSLLADERQVLVRTGEHAGFGVEVETLHDCLDAALLKAKDEPPAQLHLYSTAGSKVEELIAQGFSTTTPAVTRQPIEGNELTARLASEHVSSGLNLLQGAYAPRGEAKTHWMAWRLSAALLVVLVVAIGVNERSERVRLRAANQEADVRLETLFRNTFPDTRRTINPMAQMEQQLQSLRTRQYSARSDFLALLAEGGSALDAVDGVQLESLDYQNGRLELDLTVRDVRALDELKRTLRSQSKLAIEVMSATAADDAVRSRIRIERFSS
jgi:general secretion pathway protein L